MPDLTGRENVALPQEHGDQPDDAWLETLFDRLHIPELAARYPAALSGGEKQRVAIARALANRPAASSPTSPPASSTRRPPAGCSTS